MKVLITNPPAYIGDHERHLIQAGSRWSFSMQISKKINVKDHYLPYPFLLAYSNALLKEETDVDVAAFDGCALDMDEVEFTRRVEVESPDLLVIEVPTISFPLVMGVLEHITQTVGCRIAVAGAHVTALAQSVMAKYPFLDFALIGEYELSLKRLVEKLSSGDEVFSDIGGLAYRNNGRVVINERAHLLRDLDRLPFPDRIDFPIEHYHDFEIAGKPCAQLLTSRGCPANCIFCVMRQVMYASPLYRRRAVDRVVEEMMVVKSKYGARQVYFDDDTMTINRRHVHELCKAMIDGGLDLPWTCMADITLDRESLELMANAGCIGVKFGVETVNSKTVSMIKKSFMNLEKVKQFKSWCKELGLWTHATYVIGLPNDRREDILKTLKFSVDLDTDSAQFSIATPFPGTPFYQMAEEKGWLVFDDWTDFDGSRNSVLSYPWLSKEAIEELHRVGLRKFYLHALKQKVKQPRKVIRLLRAGYLGYAIRKTLTSLRSQPRPSKKLTSR